ncbi:MAG: hypothetical protein MUP66_02185 [Candidatus Nanohaloarchaeota archaeon QJJ-5]|nr:hypothetical protein [Candidatus Nanohaloarchaeota archaeon QJJ-5]
MSSWDELEKELEGTRPVTDSIKDYSGLLAGTALETIGTMTEKGVFRSYIDPWHGDKLIHGWFSKDLSKAVWNGTDRIGEYLDDSSYEHIATAGEKLQDPYTKTALAFGAVGAFSGLKEFVYDAEPDGLDIAANYIGFSYHMLTEHRDMDIHSYYDSLTDDESV